ncbi:hypothetical protein BDZ94DRAFT_1368514 [Collybia nuda]|uniref:Uncharacterized protein n=1 Tax=Collybia nuda TaxID=64659 RepID=A0A9P5Y6Q1_9AGAR|nr:hypothetical protein BDZ94DRAFT_1368514 [Collybia nuda]
MPNVVAIQPSTRPANLPLEVLWTLDDCCTDPDAAPIGSNHSRPPMNLAIRTQDGALISTDKYNRIRADVATLAIRSLTWYRTFYPQHVTNILEQLEHLHEELQLCSGHWKAEHMLMQHLNSCNSTFRGQKRPTTGKGKSRVLRPSLSSSDVTQPPPPAPSNVNLFIIPQLEVIPPSPCHNETSLTKRPRSNSINTTTSAMKRLRIENIFSQEYGSMKNGPLLISRLATMATTEQNAHEPSKEVMDFISHIENADPNSNDLSKDNTNENWGHYQFTAGSQTIASVLISWEAIGNVITACRLIAAGIKTCRVAWYICTKRGVRATSFLSDAYLDCIIDTLTDLSASQTFGDQAITQKTEVYLFF